MIRASSSAVVLVGEDCRNDGIRLTTLGHDGTLLGVRASALAAAIAGGGPVWAAAGSDTAPASARVRPRVVAAVVLRFVIFRNVPCSEGPDGDNAPKVR